MAVAMISSLMLAIVLLAVISVSFLNSPTRIDGNGDKVEGPPAVSEIDPPSTKPTAESTPTPSLAPTVADTPTSIHTQPSSNQPVVKPAVDPTVHPTSAVALHPTSSPTITITETPSETPTEKLSVLPSFSPTDISPTTFPSTTPKAPPAPTDPPVQCFDETGYFHNHEGDKVSCQWFQTISSDFHDRNCGKTEVGIACGLSCINYNGCTLPPSKEPTPSPITGAPTSSPTQKPLATVTIPVADDATVLRSNPDTNFGSTGWLKVDHDSGHYDVLLRFDLADYDTTRSIETASLRLKSAAECPAGGYLEKTTHSDWNEMAVTWGNAPDGDGIVVAQLGAVNDGYWYSMDVTSAFLLEESIVSFRLFPASTTECLYSSKEELFGRNAAKLHIVYA